MGSFHVGTDDQDWMLKQAKEGIPAVEAGELKTLQEIEKNDTDCKDLPT
jgi:hypothetical protein